MSTSDSVAIRACPIACVPTKSPSPYSSETVSASPRSLTISSERPSDSTSVCRTRSTASASSFRSPSKPNTTVIVRGVSFTLLDLGARGAHPRLDLLALALHPLRDLGVAVAPSLSFTCMTKVSPAPRYSAYPVESGPRCFIA